MDALGFSMQSTILINMIFHLGHRHFGLPARDMKNNNKRGKRSLVAANTNKTNKSKTRIIGQNNGMGITPKNMHKSQIVGPYAVHRLEYKSDLVILSGGTYAIKSISCNSLFDPDPAILTSTYAGFAWLSQAYDENLVQLSRAKWWVGNNKESYASVGIVYSFERLDTSIATWQEAKDALENSFSTKTIQLAPVGVGGCSRFIQAKVNLADLTKTGVYQFSELYSGQGTQNPPYEIWVNYIGFSNDGVASFDCTTEITMEATVEFYSRKRLTDASTAPALSAVIELGADKGTYGRSVVINNNKSTYGREVLIPTDYLTRGQSTKGNIKKE